MRRELSARYKMYFALFIVILLLLFWGWGRKESFHPNDPFICPVPRPAGVNADNYLSAAQAGFSVYETDQVSSDLSTGPLHDLDPEFVTSREKMGASCPGMRIRRRYNDYGQHTESQEERRFEEIYTTCGATRACGTTGGRRRAAAKLLYNDHLGLRNALPTEDDCVYRSSNGYIIKEPCGL